MFKYSEKFLIREVVMHSGVSFCISWSFLQLSKCVIIYNKNITVFLFHRCGPDFFALHCKAHCSHSVNDMAVSLFALLEVSII